jgi:hypothetical protein
VTGRFVKGYAEVHKAYFLECTRAPCHESAWCEQDIGGLSLFFNELAFFYHTSLIIVLLTPPPPSLPPHTHTKEKKKIYACQASD